MFSNTPSHGGWHVTFGIALCACIMGIVLWLEYCLKNTAILIPFEILGVSGTLGSIVGLANRRNFADLKRGSFFFGLCSPMCFTAFFMFLRH